jgi:hypothetical protein
MDSNTRDTIANTTSLGGIFAVLMDFQAELTILVLLTGLILNVTRIYSFFKGKSTNDAKDKS